MEPERFHPDAAWMLEQNGDVAGHGAWRNDVRVLEKKLGKRESVKCLKWRRLRYPPDVLRVPEPGASLHGIRSDGQGLQKLRSFEAKGCWGASRQRARVSKLM